MTVNELRDFIFENYYKQIGFVKESSYYSMKRLKKRFAIACNQINRKMLATSNAKEHYDFYLKRKNTKSVKRSKVISQQLKSIENIVDIKSVVIKHPKTSQKFSKTKQVSQVGYGKTSNSPLYSKTKKSEKIL